MYNKVLSGALLLAHSKAKPSGLSIGYRKMYDFMGKKQARTTLNDMQRHATSIHPTNKNLFKKALKHTPKQAVSSKPKQAISSKPRQTVSNKSKRRSTRRTTSKSKRFSTTQNSPTGLNIG